MPRPPSPLSVRDAQGTTYRPSTMWRPTLLLIVESIGLVALLVAVATVWQALT